MTGVARTDRPITAAAAIMAAAFGCFLVADVLELKEFGFALAAAVVLDATIVRLLLLGRVPWIPGVGSGRSSAVFDRHDLTDEEWARLEPLLPDRTPRRGGRWADHRALIDGVLWRTRTGSPWRDLPAVYGHWKTVYNRHRRWSADRIWARILDELRRGADGAQGLEWTVGVDGGVVRAHQHAAGARHAPPGDVAADVLACTQVAPGGRVE